MGFYGNIWIHEFTLNKKKRLTEKEEKRKKFEYDNCIETYKKFIKWWSSPYKLGDGYDMDVLAIAYYLNISEKSLIDKCCKFLKSISVEKFISNYELNDNERSTVEKAFKDKYIYILDSNDDYICVIDKSQSKIFDIIFNYDMTISPFDYKKNADNAEFSKETFDIVNSELKFKK